LVIVVSCIDLNNCISILVIALEVIKLASKGLKVSSGNGSAVVKGCNVTGYKF